MYKISNEQTDAAAAGVTAAEIAAAVGGRVRGDGSARITHVADLAAAGAGALAFVESSKLIQAARASCATCVIVKGEMLASEVVTAEACAAASGAAGAMVEGWMARCLIEIENPKFAFACAAAMLRPRVRPESFTHPSAVVALSARLGANVSVGAHAVIGERTRIADGAVIHAGVRVGDDVSVGENCTLHPNVVVYDGISIGKRVVLHAGAVIGADGFGYVRDAAGEYVKFPQAGTIVIEDDVEIGANSCIDRAALGETRIGAGTKIDNLVQVAHNVRIGRCVVIASQTGISGSTVIEDDCIIGGQVGFGDHARVERGAIIGSKAGVLPGKRVRGGQVYWGVPVRPLDEYKVMNAYMGRLPQMRAELDELRARVKELESRVGKD